MNVLHYYIRSKGRIVTIYIALGVDMDGHKEMYIEENAIF